MRRVRLVAVALRLDLAHATDLASFRAWLAGVLDEVTPHPSAPTLVAFPEHLGLLAMLVGERGASARAALVGGADLTAALGELVMAHAEVLGDVAGRFPAVTSPGTLLHLAATDTLVRACVEVPAQLARERGLYLAVATALAPWRTVEGERARLLRAPDVPGVGAYEPTSPAVRNRDLLLAPDGALLAIQDKATLVPLEADRDAGLGLSPIGVDELAVASTPFGRVASVISKDAWMPDVNERLAQLGAEVLLQPEAYATWGRPEGTHAPDGQARPGSWPPDNVQRGGWWMVQRHRSFRANATPMLTGSLGGLAFDGQPYVAVPAPAGDPALGLLGQPPELGWAAVGRWGGLDADPAELTGDELRRRALEVAAPVRGWEGAVAADVTLPPDAADVTLAPGATAEPSRAVAPGQVGMVPDLVADADGAWLAWVGWDTEHAQAVRVASLATAGEPAVAATLDPRPRRDTDAGDRRWRPRLAVTDRGLVCLHLDAGAGSWDLVVSRSEDGGASWTDPTRVDDADRETGVGRERLNDAPAVLARGAVVVAAWSDLRWPWVLPQVRVAVSTDGGRTWGPSRRADGGDEVAERDPIDGRSRGETRGQTAPTLGLDDDDLLVAWQELDAEGRPAVVLARWSLMALVDGALAAAPVSVVGRPGGGPRGAAYQPTLAVADGLVWLAWEQEGPAGGGVVVSTSRDGGASFDVPAPLDARVGPGGIQRRAAATVVRGGGGSTRSDPVALIVAESAGGGLVARLWTGEGPLGDPRRLDDAPAGGAVRAPCVAGRAGAVVVVGWQDTRGGIEHVRVRTIPVPAFGTHRSAADVR